MKRPNFAVFIGRTCTRCSPVKKKKKKTGSEWIPSTCARPKLCLACDAKRKGGKEAQAEKWWKCEQKPLALTQKIPFVAEKINHQDQRTPAKHDIHALVVINPRGKRLTISLSVQQERALEKHPAARSAQHQAIDPVSSILSRALYVVKIALEWQHGNCTTGPENNCFLHRIKNRWKKPWTALGEHYIATKIMSLKAGPPWFDFLVIFDFFAPWYRRSREASSVKIA